MIDSRFSVVIPAHNEASVIQRCLRALLQDATQDEIEVIVVCNGCTDDTADLARSVPGVQVVELKQPSKSSALNAGDAVATLYPRLYLDADIELTTDAARKTAACLRSHLAMTAAPTPELALDGRPVLIKAFYRAWSRSRFLTGSVIGNGVYGISELGRLRFEHFPSLTADDLYVYSLFDDNERHRLEGSTFTLHTPRKLADLVRVRTRVYYGNAELARNPDAPADPSNSLGSAKHLVSSIRSTREAFDVAAYLGINAFAKARAAKRLSSSTESDRWDRDSSSRVVVAGGGVK